MNNIAKYNARRKATRIAASKMARMPKYVVIVYDKKTDQMVDKQRFSTYENAENYKDIYKDNPNLGAYIQ